jgi:hypothetical protein
MGYSMTTARQAKVTGLTETHATAANELAEKLGDLCALGPDADPGVKRGCQQL